MKLSGKVQLIFLLLFLSALSVVLYHSTIHLFPSFIHAWTQSDRYAIALRFLDNGFDLFHPATFNLQTVNGITRVDFPLNEFIVAIIMKLVGVTAPVIFRMYTLCMSLIGLSFLYLFAKRISGSGLKAAIVVLFVFFSPVYEYYQAGFIPSVPAIAFAFAGYYYFFRYKENAVSKYFYLCVSFFLLAALIRLPFVIFLFSILLQQIFIGFRNKTSIRKELMVFIAAFLIFISYYLYNVHLGKLYGNMFLDSIKPAHNLSELKEILSEMYDHWCFHYFTVWHYILMFILALISLRNFYKRKKLTEGDQQYWFQFLIISCGMIVYFFLMARQFYAHDYYFLDSLFVPAILLFLFIIKNIPVVTWNEKAAWVASFSAFIFLFYISDHKTQAERYGTGPWDRAEVTRQNFLGTDKFLDSIGISKDAKILVIDAYTTNAPLILMNRMGYTVMGTSAENIRTSLQWCRWDYIAIQDIYLVSDVIKNYPQITAMIERVGGTGTVSFYKRSKNYTAKTLKQFLGISKENELLNLTATFENKEKDPHISNAENTVIFKNHSGISARLDSASEFGTTFSVLAGELRMQKNAKLFVVCPFQNSTPLSEVQLVVSVTSNSQQIFYQNFKIADYFKPSGLWQQMEFQFVLPVFKTPEDELKIYFWNPSRQDFYYDDMNVIIYK